MTIRVLYDGWALAYAPASPAALHLLALFSALNDAVAPLVALPAECAFFLPPAVIQIHQPTSAAPAARLVWEQRTLPALAGENGAAVLHLTGHHSPLGSRVALAVSPAEPHPRWRGAGGFGERLRAALAAGLQDNLSALLLPQDLPDAPPAKAVYRLPPLAALPETGDAQPTALEPGYVLYHGPGDDDSLRTLLMGWSWAADAIGEYAPLLLAGLSASESARAANLAAQGGFAETVQFAGLHPDWRAVYRDAALLVSVSPALPWGDPVAQAMAAGKAIVALEEPLTAARVGAAAYLTPPGADRALGAAITTLVVETEMADELGASAAERAAQWNSPAFGGCLADVYREIVARR